jgi:hypothetical protein
MRSGTRLVGLADMEQRLLKPGEAIAKVAAKDRKDPAAEPQPRWVGDLVAVDILMGRAGRAEIRNPKLEIRNQFKNREIPMGRNGTGIGPPTSILELTGRGWWSRTVLWKTKRLLQQTPFRTFLSRNTKKMSWVFSTPLIDSACKARSGIFIVGRSLRNT